MSEIFVPQNTIDSARPADLSFAGEHEDFVNTANRALELRRETEALRSNEAYTKAIKANTDPNSGALNMAGVQRQLKNDRGYTLNADHYTPISEDISSRNASLAKMFNDSDSRLDAMLKTGVISQKVANMGKALNENGRKNYGILNKQAPYGSEAYSETGIATSAKPEVFDSGDSLMIGNRPAIASSKTPVSFNQSISKGVTPGEKIEATMPRPYTVSTPNGLETRTVQPTVERSGQTHINIDQPTAVQSEAMDAYTKQIAQEYADAPQNLRQAQQNESNYSEAANSILNGEGKPNLAILSKVFGGAGLPVGSTGQREAIAKNIAATLSSNGMSTDLARSYAEQASGANSQNPEVMQLANFLNRAKNMQDVLHNNFLVNNENNPKKIEHATQMGKQYGDNIADLSMLHLLAQEGINNPTLYKKNIEVMRKYMPKKLTEIWNKRALYQQAIKDGAVIHGYDHSPIFNKKK